MEIDDPGGFLVSIGMVNVPGKTKKARTHRAGLDSESDESPTSLLRGGAFGLGETFGEYPLSIEFGHVSIIGTVIDLDEPECLGNLLGGPVEIPAAIHGAVGDLNHRGAIDPVMAMKINGLIRRVGDHRSGPFELIGDPVGEFGRAFIHDRNVDPLDPHVCRKSFLADGHRMFGRMSEGDNRFDLLVANDSLHRPGLLPGSPVDFAGLDRVKLVGEDVILPVSPRLLADQPEQKD